MSLEPDDVDVGDAEPTRIQTRPIGERLVALEVRMRAAERLASVRHTEIRTDVSAVADDVAALSGVVQAHAGEMRVQVNGVIERMWQLAVVVGVIAGTLGLGGQVVGQLVGQ